MKKYAAVLLLVFFVPSVAFAAWWNPFTWFSSSPVEVVVQQDPKPVPIPVKTTPKKKTVVPKKITPIAPVQDTTQQPVVPTPPPNTMLCNGTYWNQCPSGQDFVCPATGSAYCQASQQAQEQEAIRQKEAQTALVQQQIEQMKALKSEYDRQIAALEQQIVDITNQYYKDIDLIDHSPGYAGYAEGKKAMKYNEATAKIAQIKNQEQQLYLDFTAKINALQ